MSTAADARVHPFAVILVQAGDQTITATDLAAGIRASVIVTVNPAAADHFSVSGPVGGTAGTALDVSVTALDPFNNIDFNYQGTVHFTTTDMGSGSDLPPDTTFTGADGGVHV